MKKNIYFWLVMFLAISLLLPVYSMAQITPTLTLESYTTGDRISGAPIKSFYWGTDGNLVVYLNGPFTFSTLATNISLNGTSGTYSGCTVSPPASVTATPGANLSFSVFSTTANANLSMVVDPDPGFIKVNGAVPQSSPTTPSPSPLTISWDTTGIPAGPYLAVFEAQVGTQTPSQLVVAINISQQYKLTLTAGANGTVSPVGDSYYDPGTSVSISATGNLGYYFSAWSGGLTGNTNPTQIVMNGNKTVTATFTQTPPTQYTVATSVLPSGAGTVTGAGTYNNGALVTITATPVNSTFSYWSEGASPISISTANPYSFNIAGNRNLVANFTVNNTPSPGACTNPLDKIAPKSGYYYGIDDMTLAAGTVRTYCLPIGTLYPNGDYVQLNIESYSLGVVAGGDIALKLTSPEGIVWLKDSPTSSNEILTVLAGVNYAAGRYLNKGNWTLEVTAKISSRIRLWWYVPY